MNTRRERYLFAAVLVALLCAAGWSWSELSRAKQAAADATRQTADARALAAAIMGLRAAPALAGSRDLAASEVVARINNAAAAAAIDSAAITRIDPAPARRVGETPYTERPTTVALRRVTLGQVVGFLHAIADADPALHVRDLKLTAPYGEESAGGAGGATGDRWTVELTVSALTFSPAGSSSAGVGLE